MVFIDEPEQREREDEAARQQEKGADQPSACSISSITPPPTIAPAKVTAERMLPASGRSAGGNNWIASALTGMSAQVENRDALSVNANRAILLESTFIAASAKSDMR